MTARRIRHGRTATAALALAAGIAIAPVAPAGAAKRLERPSDPVVITGTRAEALLGSQPGRVVAFAYRSGDWRQVPVQVDERKRVDLGDVYAGTRPGIEIETYADPSTLTGPDPDPRVDADDEIALMARDAGAKAPLRRGKLVRPRQLARGAAVDLRVKAPETGAVRHLYLFRSKRGKLDPSAGKDLVDYRFALLSGSYPQTFDFRNGPNPESSTVETPSYKLRFTDRWINDQLVVRAGGAERFDLLDRRKAQFAPGVCGR